MSERNVPWGLIGHTFDEAPDSVADALEIAGLDWEVEKRKVGYTNAKGNYSVYPDKFAVVRTDTDRPVGVVGKVYTPVQNADALAFVNDLTGDGDITHAWERQGGASVGLAVKFGESISFDFADNDDGFQPWLELHTRHDGTQSVQCRVKMIQLVCTNGMTAPVTQARWRAIHSAKVNESMNGDTVASVLKLVNDNVEATYDHFKAFADQRVTDAEFWSIVNKTLRPHNLSEKLMTRTTADIKSLWENSKTLDESLRNTAFGAMHAITEYWDHKRRYRTPTARFNVNSIGVGNDHRHAFQRELIALGES